MLQYEKNKKKDEPTDQAPVWIIYSHHHRMGGGVSLPKRKQVFQLVYLNCVIFDNETTNVLFTRLSF